MRLLVSHEQEVLVFIIIIIIIIIIFINCKWVDIWWQWSFYILHMHGLLKLITLDLVGEGYMGSM
jgi:hypothetical protein